MDIEPVGLVWLLRHAPPPPFWGLLALGVFIVVGVVLALRFKKEAEEELADTYELLSELESARETGELSDEELRRVRALLAGGGADRAAGGPAPPSRPPLAVEPEGQGRIAPEVEERRDHESGPAPPMA